LELKHVHFKQTGVCYVLTIVNISPSNCAVTVMREKSELISSNPFSTVSVLFFLLFFVGFF